MRRVYCMVCLVLLYAVGATAGDKNLIKKNVDGIVDAINKGKALTHSRPTTTIHIPLS